MHVITNIDGSGLDFLGQVHGAVKDSIIKTGSFAEFKVKLFNSFPDNLVSVVFNPVSLSFSVEPREVEDFISRRKAEYQEILFGQYFRSDVEMRGWIRKAGQLNTRDFTATPENMKERYVDALIENYFRRFEDQTTMGYASLHKRLLGLGEFLDEAQLDRINERLRPQLLRMEKEDGTVGLYLAS